MTVLWLVNIVLPEAGEALKINSSVFGGWLTGALNGVRGRAEITVAAIGGEDVREVLECDAGSVHYVVFPHRGREELKEAFRAYLVGHDFDVIHIYGTEMLHSAVMMEVAPVEKTVINIQGLTSYYRNHCLEGVPERAARDNFFKKAVRGLLRGRFFEPPASTQMRWMEESAQRETAIIQKCRHMIGRTGWDRACVTQLNPGLHYYHVNETLRAGFYTDRAWSPDRCCRHTIFLSQASYPVKGLHYFMQALEMIRRVYPDVHVYVAGDCGIKGREGLRAFRDRHFGGYFGYVNTYLADHGLLDCFTLCGLLDERAMVRQYLDAHVFVCPSTIENSPNSVGEAMMLGTPVVASYVGGVPDMLDNGREGLLYPASAPYMLADCVMRIFADDDLAKKLSQNAMARAHITHDREKNAMQLIRAYTEIIQPTEE